MQTVMRSKGIGLVQLSLAAFLGFVGSVIPEAHAQEPGNSNCALNSPPPNAPRLGPMVRYPDPQTLKPNYSGCTLGQGHFVPEVVSVKETRHLERCRFDLRRDAGIDRNISHLSFSGNRNPCLKAEFLCDQGPQDADQTGNCRAISRYFLIDFRGGNLCVSQ